MSTAVLDAWQSQYPRNFWPTLQRFVLASVTDELAGRLGMRPVNEDRVIVEYARISRIVEVTLDLEEVESFGVDLLARLEDGVNLTGRWWHREWRLGNIDPRRDSAGNLPQISGQFGWYGQTETVDAPPPYDESTHSWAAEPTTAPEGSLALFGLDVESQMMAITSLFGDVQVPGFCHAMTDLLSQAEIQASQVSEGLRAKRDWLVERIDQGGTFEAWVESMERVTRVSAQFHRPNPRTRDDIEPAVTYLNELHATNGSIAAKGEELDPYGHPMMQAAIAMQQHDYGSVTAEGIKGGGEVDKFASREHPTRDTITADPQDPTLSIRGIVALIFRALADRIESGMR